MSPSPHQEFYKEEKDKPWGTWVASTPLTRSRPCPLSVAQLAIWFGISGGLWLDSLLLPNTLVLGLKCQKDVASLQRPSLTTAPHPLPWFTSLPSKPCSLSPTLSSTHLSCKNSRWVDFLLAFSPAHSSGPECTRHSINTCQLNQKKQIM